MSFFVTARYAGQNDRIAYAEVLIEQLAELLGETLPPLLTEATREAHLLRMLARAAEACRDQGQRLVLVVDGLDEDRGVTNGADAHSIAALLPPTPPADMRVVVAGRPNPPIPTDVPDNHPLRDTANVRVLAGSPHAAVVRQDAQRELKRLSTGSHTEQDLLGLLTAAGGGLSGADLAELTNCSRWDIDEELSAVSARTFTPRSGRWQPETTVYVLGHEELQQQASQRLGQGRLVAYRQRLHDWADDYRNRSWPAGTPEYLLRGYFRLLQAIGDLRRMVTLATDSARHQRMLDITGGDYMAVTEVTLTGEAILTSGQPDLAAMGRLTAARFALTQRNSKIPSNLPAVWARLGNPYRAEALARSIADPAEQVRALAAVTQAVAASDPAYAQTLADSTEVLARSLTARYEEREAMAWAAEAVATVSGSAAAETIAGSITKPDEKALTLAAIAKTVAAAGNLDHAQRLAGQAENLAMSAPDPFTKAWVLGRVAPAVAAAGDPAHAEVLAYAIGNPFQQVAALARVAHVVAAAGDHAHAHGLAECAESLALTLVLPDGQAPLRDTAVAVAAAGDPAHAEDLARSLTTPYAQAEVLAGVAEAVAAGGNPTHAEALACSIPDPAWRAEALSGIAWEVAARGNLEHARRLAEQAESLARSIDDPHEYGAIMVQIAEAAAAAGDLERAVALARRAEVFTRSLTHPYEQAQAFVGVARALAAAGDTAHAEALARSIPDPEWRAQALAGVARAVAVAGNATHARILAEHAEAAANSGSDRFGQTLALADVAEAVAAAGDTAHAETLARSITHHYERARALAGVAKAAATTQNARAEQVALTIIVPEWRAWTLAVIAQAVATAGDSAHAQKLVEEAEATVRLIPDPQAQDAIVTEVAQAVAATGDTTRAEAIARSIIDPSARAGALAAVAVGVDSPRADHLLAEALHSDNLDRTLMALTQVQPAAFATLADSLQCMINEQAESRIAFGH